MGLFKSKEERRIEQDIKIRQGIRRIEKAIAEQNKFSDEFVKNARNAKQIGDMAQYAFIRNSLKKTATIKKLLERQVLAVKNALLIKRQAEASADFAGAMTMMASEVSKLYGDMDLSKTQMQWEKAISQSQSMEERMTLFLEAIEQGAAADVTAAPAEAISDEEIDRLITAEEQVEKARETQQISALRAELNALKGQGETGKETK
jgi:DNA polymerase III alpha subunit (gram-positive type)